MNAPRGWFRFVRDRFWAAFLIAALVVGSIPVVRAWKSAHPGSMTVIESQAMDMTAMKPPTGAVPVATAIVRPRGFSATVTYTGSVAPYTEQVIYARAAADKAATASETEAAKNGLAGAKAALSAARQAETQREEAVKSAEANAALAQTAVDQADEDYRVIRLRYEAGKSINLKCLTRWRR